MQAGAATSLPHPTAPPADPPRAAVGVMRQMIAPGLDHVRIATPHYVLDVEVRHDRGRAKILRFGRGALPSLLSQTRRGWFERTFLPRVIKLCPTCGNDNATTEIRVSLPQMVAHRAAACRACPNQRRFLFIRYCALCNCILWIKHRVAAATCPDTPDRWIERTT